MDLIEKYIGEKKEIFISKREALDMLKKAGLNPKHEGKEGELDVYYVRFGRTKHTFVFKRDGTIQKRFIEDAIEDNMTQGIGSLSGI